MPRDGPSMLDEPGQGDKRIHWLEQRVSLALKLRPNDARKLFDNEDNRILFLEFFETPPRESIFIAGTASGQWKVISSEHDPHAEPIDLRRKLLYFLKRKPEKLTDDKAMANLMFGDVSPDVLQTFHHVQEGFWLPLLKQRIAVNNDIPPVHYPGIVDASQKLLSETVVVCGKQHRRTKLPLPAAKLPLSLLHPETGIMLEFPRDLVAELEVCVNGWIEQISAAVKAEPAVDLPLLLAGDGRLPGPLDEVEFWAEKVKNLTQLAEQLCHPTIAKATIILKSTGSNSFTPFTAASQSVHSSLFEASEIHRFLSPIIENFERISPAGPGHLSIPDLAHDGDFRKVFQLLYVVWTNCPQFSTAGRMVNLISGLAADVVENARETVNGADVYEHDTQDFVEQLSAMLRACGEFKAAYFYFKARSAKELQRPWRFQNGALFRHLDLFLERVHDLLDLVDTAGLFLRLENVRIGGPDGLDRTNEVLSLRTKFLDAFQTLQAAGPDPLDVRGRDFEIAYNTFRDDLLVIEQRLGVLLADSLDESRAIGNTFKVVDTFDGFTDRPVLHREWSTRETKVLSAWHDELMEAQEEFVNHRDRPLEFPHTPVASSIILWCDALIRRVNESERRVTSSLSSAVMNSDAGQDAIRLHRALLDQIKTHMGAAHEQWSGAVGLAAAEKLQLPILVSHEIEVPVPQPHLTAALVGPKRRESILKESGKVKRSSLDIRRHVSLTSPDGTADMGAKTPRPSARSGAGASDAPFTSALATTAWAQGPAVQRISEYAVNFDPQLARTLHDVAKIERVAQDSDDTILLIPQQAGNLHRQKHTLRRQVLGLEYVCSTVNSLSATVLSCERMLLENELRHIKSELERGLKELRWTTADSVTQFVDEATETVRQVDGTVQALRGSVEQICDKLHAFYTDDQFFQTIAADARVLSESDLRRRYADHVASRGTKAEEINEQSLALIDETALAAINKLKQQYGQSEIGRSTAEWGSYRRHAAQSILSALQGSLCGSLSVLKDYFDPATNTIMDPLARGGGPTATGLVTVRLLLTRPSGPQATREVPRVMFDPPMDEADLERSRRPSRVIGSASHAAILAGIRPTVGGGTGTPPPHPHPPVKQGSGHHAPAQGHHTKEPEQATLQSIVREMAWKTVELSGKFVIPGGTLTEEPPLTASDYITYTESVHSAPQVHKLLTEIDAITKGVAAACLEYRETFGGEFSFLHQTTLQEQLDQFFGRKPSKLKNAAAVTFVSGGDDNDEEKDGSGEEDEEDEHHEDIASPAVVVDHDEDDTAGLDQYALAKLRRQREETAYFGVPLSAVDAELVRLTEIETELDDLPSTHTIGLIKIDSKPLKFGLLELCRQRRHMLAQHVYKKVCADLEKLYAFMQKSETGLDVEVADGDVIALKNVMRCIRGCADKNKEVHAMLQPLASAAAMLKGHPEAIDPADLEALEGRRQPALEAWQGVHRRALNAREQHSVAQDREAENVREETAAFQFRVTGAGDDLRRSDLYALPPAAGQSDGHGGIVNPADALEDEMEDGIDAYARIDAWAEKISVIEGQANDLRTLQSLFDLTPTEFKELREYRHELVALKQLWDLAHHVLLSFRAWMDSPFRTVDVDGFLDEIKRLQKQLKTQSMKAKSWRLYKQVEDEVINMAKTLPLCAELRSSAMRDRHWEALREVCQYPGQLDPHEDSFTLQRLVALGVHKHSDEVYAIVEKAQKELQIEKSLARVVSVWEKTPLDYTKNADFDLMLLASVDTTVEQLETDTNTLQSILSNRFVAHFLDDVRLWQRNLGLVDTCLNKWVDIQRKWLNLFPIFVLSADIREQLPEDARNFTVADDLFRAMMKAATPYSGVIEVMCTDVVVAGMQRNDDLESVLNTIEQVLVDCERALTEYLETKRKLFPRFYFVSSGSLVDILSKGSNPRAVMVHVSKIIDSVEAFTIDNNPNDALTKSGKSSPPQEKRLSLVMAEDKDEGGVKVWQMISVQGEEVRLASDFICQGPVEHWLAGCVKTMQAAVRKHITDAHNSYVDRARNEWIYDHPCQAVIVASRSWFTAECQGAFHQLEEGTETAMKDFLKQQKAQLDSLIKQVLTDQKSNDRKMLVHLITIDVHNRDVVQVLVDEKIDSAESFQWQSQLRYYFDEKRGSEIRISDAYFQNQYEYIGLCGCLVITPLTDRCYITLSQALKLNRGGAPAGPAGTGKTETTKDLARNLGVCCYVFNCSDQMNYITLGQIFKGLAMTGAWGCFDEFNRISIEVLSVVATQVGSILNGLKGRKERFRFMAEEIPLVPSVGIFITMNPGYAGRTELPENIKSLFRPCAMVVPDLKNICEIMLAAEGFGDAKDLSLKFVTLYRLNKELLSPQDHYDWGLRAVKSVLYIAGALKRQDPDVPERKVLMRALRDTNLAKLSKDDVYVFSGLIKALFPGLEIAKKDKPELRAACMAQCKAMGNFPGEADIFILKCLQFEELLHVRHSVFILGPTGCGKTQMWRCLQGALARTGDKCAIQALNPKAITSNELYGFIHTQTKEWRDGILSQIFRNFYMESKTKKHSKWIVLDGIIDAEWIESMNTVMDDNKVLTLVSNERIPLTDSMRLVFEVSHLANASPATVSRAGVLFINESDLGWGPFKDKWLANLSDDREATLLEGLFDRYVPVVFEYWKRASKPTVAVMDINIVQTLCNLLEGLLANLTREQKTQEVYEKYFSFATVWAFGGPLPTEGRIDYRATFSTWWRKEFNVKVGDQATVFDYFIDHSAGFEFRPWSGLVQQFVYDPELPLAAVTVPTADTVRVSSLMSLLMDNGKPVMLIGTAGTGKSNLMMSKLRACDTNKHIFRVIAFNARTGSASLQTVMEQALEKRSGRQYGPIGRKQLTFFLDDVNMANPDKYGTQEGMALIQQHMGYGFWYDRTKILQKDIVDVHYCAAMNPKSGTFSIIDRVLRHFALFCTCMPDRPDLRRIYGQILQAHFESGFGRDVQNLVPFLTNATIDLHAAVGKAFLPTAALFHYQWNMRELFNIVQGLCSLNPALHRDDHEGVARLWAHECVRTFRDRMPGDEDQKKFDELLHQAQRTFAEAGLQADVFAKAETEQLLWAPIGVTQSGEENVTDEVTMQQALEFFTSKMGEYNSMVANMDLVLFQQAVEHICRISRVLSNARGNALLVGVGGSGKQSLARLAGFINLLDLFQIQVTGGYNIGDFRTEIQELYKRCGLKGNATAFIITDQQIVTEDMLVYLNDMLSSGNIPDLFAQDERDGIISSITNEVKATGHPEYSNPDVCWDFFLQKVRSHLHVVLCFSPVAKTFSEWCRSFPALSNTTVIDWFHPWPVQALKSVARRFLADVDFTDAELLEDKVSIDDEPEVTNAAPVQMDEDGMPQQRRPSLINREGTKRNLTHAVADFVAECHDNLSSLAEEFYHATKRRCYTTPKSFLELIALYKALLGKKRAEVDVKRDRLQAGSDKIEEAGAQVADLQAVLVKDSALVAEAREKTQQLLEHVSREKAIVEEQAAVAQVEEDKTNLIVQEVQSFAAECKKDLDAAQPLVEEARAALDTLNKANLTELKSMARPPEDVVMVCAAVKILTSDPRRIPGPKGRDWAACKQMMGQVSQWMQTLQSFDQDNIPQPCVDAMQTLVTNPQFVPAIIETKSLAASSLCKWVVGMNEYHKVRCHVRPKEERLAESQDRLAHSKAALKRVQDKVSELQARLDQLLQKYNEAVTEAEIIEAKATKTRDKMNLANRLVDGLADEKVRWRSTTEGLAEQRRLLIGDVLVASAFVSYIGPFTRDFRSRIIKDVWIPRVEGRGIPLTEDLDVILGVLTTEAEVASWNNDGLPSDPMSTQNGAIVTTCARWPLLVDPQLQAVRWIRTREERNGLVVLHQGGPRWVDKVAQCVEDGIPCLIEALGETIDPVLNNVLGRVTYTRGSRVMMRIGSHDVEVSPKFRLYLQTRHGNPHYQPEVNAQTTLVNCMVTEDGLEDQLLAVVVNKERPDLEEKRVSLHRHMNTMTIELQECEDGLLYELSNATGDILENVALVETLEQTKRKAVEIQRSMAVARETQATLAASRQTFRAVASRGSLLFFQIDQLNKIDHMYQYSLEAFMVVFFAALAKAPEPVAAGSNARRSRQGGNKEEMIAHGRVDALMKSVTESVFAYVARGLFERHKLVLSSLLCFAIQTREGAVDRRQLQFLLTGPRKYGTERPETVREWCSDAVWATIQALADVDGTQPPFQLLPTDCAESNRWRQWAELEKPEDEKLPSEWKNLSPFQRLLVLRCFRPDRLTNALEKYVASSLGQFFVADQAVSIGTSFGDAGVSTPLFFILSPGVDPVGQVEALGRKLGYTYENEKLHNVSLGQGQEVVAERALDICFHQGGWAMLSNVHLVARWLLKLEKTLDAYAEVYVKMGQRRKHKQEKRAAKILAWRNQQRRASQAAAASRRASRMMAGEQVTDEDEEEQEPYRAETPADDEVRADGSEEVAEVGAEGSGAFGQFEEGGFNNSRRRSSGAGSGHDDEGMPNFTDSSDSDNDEELAEQRKLERGHPDFRLFLSAEPSKVIPLGVLQRCIKLTSEPPSGIALNMKRALTNFADEPWDRSSKPTDFRAVTFAMCFFHAVVVERKKFGPQGWNRTYPFNVGDLTTCIDVLSHYVEDRPKVPWDDLRYVFGEIMYGGHITDDWDRVLCMAYLKQWIQPDVADHLELCPGFPVPAPGTYQDYISYVDQNCPPEAPVLYGLHANAEVAFRTVQADALFTAVRELQPSQRGGAVGDADTDEIRIKVDELIDKTPELLNLLDISERLDDDRTPPQHVFYQECERMNLLLEVLKRALGELKLGLAGVLSLSGPMQQLLTDIAADRVPEVCQKVAFASLRGLASWFDSLCQRHQQLLDWTAELVLPKVTLLNLLISPVAFLTAISQHTAISNKYDLDQMALVCDVTKKSPDQIDVPARDGAFVYGMRLEGARWDVQMNCIETAKLGELYPKMPVVTIRALPLAKADRRDQYECPMYKTAQRGPTFVASLWLKTKQPARKWTIGGVGILLDVSE